MQSSRVRRSDIASGPPRRNGVQAEDMLASMVRTDQRRQQLISVLCGYLKRPELQKIVLALAVWTGQSVVLDQRSADFRQLTEELLVSQRPTCTGDWPLPYGLRSR